MSARKASRMEALAVLRHHREHYRARVIQATAKGDLELEQDAETACRVIKELVDVLEGRRPPLEVEG